MMVRYLDLKRELLSCLPRFVSEAFFFKSSGDGRDNSTISNSGNHNIHLPDGKSCSA